MTLWTMTPILLLSDAPEVRSDRTGAITTVWLIAAWLPVSRGNGRQMLANTTAGSNPKPKTCRPKALPVAAPGRRSSTHTRTHINLNRFSCNFLICRMSAPCYRQLSLAAVCMGNTRGSIDHCGLTLRGSMIMPSLPTAELRAGLVRNTWKGCYCSHFHTSEAT